MHLYLEKFLNTKGVIRSIKSIEGQTTQWPKEKVQMTNNDSQNITQKTKDRATRNQHDPH